MVTKMVQHKIAYVDGKMKAKKSRSFNRCKTRKYSNQTKCSPHLCSFMHVTNSVRLP